MGLEQALSFLTGGTSSSKEDVPSAARETSSPAASAVSNTLPGEVGNGLHAIFSIKDRMGEIDREFAAETKPASRQL